MMSQCQASITPLLPAPPARLGLPAPQPAPPPPTAAQKAKAWAERVAGETDAAVATLGACQDRLDRAAVSADQVLRSLDEARVPLMAIAKERCNRVDAAWARAGELVARSAALAGALGSGLAVDVVGPLESSARVIEHADTNMYGADKKVKDNAHPAGERASESSKRLQATLDPLRQQGAKVAAAVAQAAAGMGAPVSKVAAEAVLKAVETARWKLQDAVRDAEVVQKELYRTRQDASSFTGDVREGLQGAFTTRPAGWAGELDALRQAIENVPAALDRVDAGLKLGGPAAAPITKLLYAVQDGIRKQQGGEAGGREAATDALFALRGAVENLERTVLGAGPRVIADQLAPLWAQVREPAARVKAMDAELRAKDDESRVWIFGRQYGRVHEALEPAFEGVPRGAYLVQSGLERGLEMPVRFLEMKRLIDDSVRWSRQDPEVGGGPLEDNMFRMKRLVMEMTIGIPTTGTAIGGTGSLLGNAGRFLGAGVPAMTAAAEKARESQI